MSAEVGRPRIVPLGDAALLVVLGERVDPALSRRVHRLARDLDDLHAHDPRFGRPVPAYASVLVPVDPLDPGVDLATGRLAELLQAHDVMTGEADPIDPSPTPVEVPTRYGGGDGPDLQDVAELNGLTAEQVIDAHASATYVVHFLGFAPGFAYLGPVPAAIATSRLATPRPRVPAGSVGIAGEQTAIYPTESPGGWRLIGRTTLRVWDPSADPPALLTPGRRVRFVPVDR